MRNTPELSAIPVWGMPVDSQAAIRRAVADAVCTQASRELALPYEKLVTRGIRVSDLGLASWVVHPKQYAGEWFPFVNTYIADQSYICIYKIVILDWDSVISEMRISVGGSTRAIYELTELYSVVPLLQNIQKLSHKEAAWIEHQFGNLQNIRMESWLPAPVLAPQNCTLKVDISCGVSPEGKSSTVVLGGIVVEPRGKNVAP